MGARVYAMLQEPGGSQRHSASCWARAEMLLDEVFGQRSNCAGHMVLVLLNPVQRKTCKKKNECVSSYVVSVLQSQGLEWWIAHQEGVEDAAKEPDVHLVAVALVTKDLWGDVVGSPEQHLLPLSVEINLGGQTVVEENISQFKISVLGL